MSKEDEWCHYSGMPSPNAYNKTKMSNVLTERERFIIFHSRNLDYRMNNWTPEEQHDKAGIPKLRSELTDNDKTFLLLNQNKENV